MLEYFLLIEQDSSNTLALLELAVLVPTVVTVMVKFMCQLTGLRDVQRACKTLFLGAFVRVFLGEIGI